MANLKVNVVSNISTLWQGEAKLVVAPAADGEIGLLAGHTPLLSILREGQVRITPLTATKPITINVSSGGFLSVDDDQVTIVSEDAELVSARN